MNLIGSILHFGTTRRQDLALIEGARALTYGDLADLVRRTSGQLAALGVRHGDRIGLCLKDSLDHIVALLAVAHVGGVAVPLDWRARPAENARFIQDIGLACVLVEQDAARLDGCVTVALDAAWQHAVQAADPGAEYPTTWQDPFLISATSGSTGAPKLTLMTHTQYYFAISGMIELLGLAGRHRFLCTMPLYYSGGRNSCIAHLLRGDCVVLYPSLFSPDEYVDVVGRHDITVGGLVPSMVRQLLAAGGQGPILPSLAMLFCTGAPLHAEEKRRAVRHLTPHFHERYGTAETLAISILRPGDFAARADSVGQPHSLAEISIVDEQDRLLPVGATGLLRYRGPGLATKLGPRENANFRHGAFYPGEIARLDAAGYIFLQGRVSDVIMRSGAKIYPAEIEAALAEHTGVAEAAVLGHCGVEPEEQVVAFIVPRGPLLAGEVLAHCRARLTPHKVPRQIHFMEQLPKNAAGKIDKLALASLLAVAGTG